MVDPEFFFSFAWPIMLPLGHACMRRPQPMTQLFGHLSRNGNKETDLVAWLLDGRLKS